MDESKCKCNARFVVKEERCRFELLDCVKEEVDKYKIDNYLIQDKRQKKCDYYFYYHTKFNPNTCIFVELKGNRIDTAIEQLDSTLTHFENNGYFDLVENAKVVCAIVYTSYPNNDATYRRLEKKLNGNHKKMNLQIERKKLDMRYNPKTGECFGKGEK